MFSKYRDKNSKTGRQAKGNIKKVPFYYQMNRYLNTEDAELGKREATDDNSPKTLKKSAWRQVPGFLSIIVIGACFVYAITLTDNPKVEVVNDSTTALLRPLSVYRAGAIKIINSSLSSKTKLTINTNRIAQQFENEYPEIKSASLIIPLVNHTPILEIQPADPVFILSNSSGKFIIDSSGRAILAESKGSLASMGLPEITDQSGLPVKLGVQTISDNTISFIETITSQFQAKSVKISSMALPAIPYEFDVHLINEPYYLKFNLQGDARVEVGTYLVVSKQLSSTPPSQYIDLRVDGRAYYQ